MKMRKRKKYTKFRAPRGFDFKITTSTYKGSLYSVKFSLIDTQKRVPIGDVTLVRRDGEWPRSYETHSWLDSEYHNRRLGILMYCRAIDWAIKHKKKVRSSGASSEAALRVWKGKSLRAHFKIRTVHCRAPDLRDDPSYDTFFVYRK